GRCPACWTGRSFFDRRRRRNGVRVSRDRGRILSGAVSVVRAARSSTDAARCLGRLTAGGCRNSATAGSSGRTEGIGPVSEGLGVLVFRVAGEPYFLPGHRIFPLAASAPVVGFGARHPAR